MLHDFNPEKGGLYMRILQIITVAYQRPKEIKLLISSFIVQTNPAWKMYIIHDGPTPEEITNIITEFHDDRLILCESKTRKGKWGHPNRKMMLDKIPCEPDDPILLTNDDNFYVRTFVDKMLTGMTKSVGMVYCDMLTNYYDYDIIRCIPKVNSIDMGAFVVRADIAKKVGFNSVKFQADGEYCEEVVKCCKENNYRVLKIEKILFIHN
jgi:GT2 family glycosyltransferase